LTANTLADLTKPENRYAHRPPHVVGPGNLDFGARFPFHPHFFVNYIDPARPLLGSPWWGPRSGAPYDGGPRGLGLGLPTLGEASCATSAYLEPFTVTPSGIPFDAWSNPYPWSDVDRATGTINRFLATAARVSEDVILQNVIGFDVKAWDPGAPVLLATASGQVLMPGDPGYFEGLRYIYVLGDATYTVVSLGAYVDLNYACVLGSTGLTNLVRNTGSVFAGPGITGLPGVNGYRNLGTDPSPNPTVLRSAVYDTWSTHYERELGTGRGINGFDDNGDGVVDDPGEMEFPPPYAAPLRGIQVKIRCFEPDSRQVREVTVIQEFVTK
jgi:hypothetical protein